MHNPAHLVANSDPAAPQELFALTDEQILEIDPETNEERNGQETSTSSSVDRKANDARTSSTLETAAGAKAAAAGSSLSAAATGNEPPRWLAEMMGDPNRGGEAEDFWQGVTQARQEAAAYREVFAKPEEARAAAQRARALDEIDRAYFGGNPGDRAQLVATMMREDTAAFREMVVEGLRALEEAEKGRGAGNGGGDSRLAWAFAGASVATQGTATGNTAAAATGASSRSNPEASSVSTAGSGSLRAAPAGATAQQGNAEHDARLAAYASFEKSANEDLERSVSGNIVRTLEQAIPSAAHGDSGALKSRLVGAIRQDVEKALQGDRQLGEQVAQLLSGKQLNEETRAQVVRLIGDRAAQLVPGAAKRALKDWTESTLAAHRERTGRGAAAATRQEVSPIATANRSGGDSQNNAGRGGAASARGAAGRSVDYRKLSDEQILAM